MDDKTKDALHNMLGIMASLNVGYVPTPGFVAEAVTPHLPGMTEAVRDAIQAVEALERVRKVVDQLDFRVGHSDVIYGNTTARTELMDAVHYLKGALGKQEG